MLGVCVSCNRARTSRVSAAGYGFCCGTTAGSLLDGVGFDSLREKMPLLRDRLVQMLKVLVIR
jgi:hypothetical protein